ncbi:hypothetical protein [Zavarzinella formosa]|uniref:hypothetical protein n=1 Tax=Zavarzinella formosa TaxID=360055 RepID=UPI0002E27266|nr:hypothetical protein [Zavarzinella formosa]
MRHRIQNCFHLILALLFSAMIGCDSKPEIKLVPVSGTVTLDGKPLADGLIYFKTQATGATNSLPVKDGKFEGNVEAGDRRVEINAYKVRTEGFGQMGGEVKESLIPKRFNTESTLTAKVAAGSPNQFNFEVTSK